MKPDAEVAIYGNLLPRSTSNWVDLFIIDDKGSVPISNCICTISKQRKEGGYGKAQEDRTEERNRPKEKTSGGTNKTKGERSERKLAAVSGLGLVT
jgi:hypothetical protein